DGSDLYLATLDNTHPLWPADGTTLVTLARDSSSGKLTLQEPKLFDSPAGTMGYGRDWGITVSPDGLNVYVVSVLGSLSVFGRNPTTGTATFLEVHREGVAGVDGLLGAHSVEVSPDGKHVYVAAGYPDGFAGFAADDKVSMFQRNAL